VMAAVPQQRARASSALCVAAMGFTLMALEISLLLAFQAIYGYVYRQLAIVIAAFMVGMALGSRRALVASRQRELRALTLLQAIAAISPLLLYVCFVSLARVGSAMGLQLVAEIGFPALALACGFLGGFQFPLACRVFMADGAARAGTFYALDLAGACVGALLVSAYLIPVFGFARTGWLIAAANLVPAALVWLASAAAPLPR